MPNAIRTAIAAFAYVLLLAAAPATVFAQGRIDSSSRAVEEAPPVDPAAAQAADALLTGCDAGDLSACKGLGDAYLKGDGVGRLDAVAQMLYEQACEGDHGAACEALAGLYDAPQFPSMADFEQAYTRAFTKACDLGTLTACAQLARLVKSGSTLTEPDPERAMQIADRACRSGGDDACLLQSEFLRQDGRSDADYALGMALLDTLCRKGSPVPDADSRSPQINACRAALEELDGAAVPDERLIDEYLRSACNSGVAYQCKRAGDRAYRGASGEPDVARAQQFLNEACRIASFWCDTAAAIAEAPDYQASCQIGVKAACFELGKIHANRNSVLADPVRAWELLSESCFGGIGAACAPAADVLAYQLENAVPDAEHRIAELLDRACAAENNNACFDLAEKFEQGSGVEQDQQRAGILYARACTGGLAFACASWEKMSGIAPEVPVAVADDSFLPPFSSDENANAELAAAMRERSPIVVLPCLRYRGEFRGNTYEEVHCPPVVATVNGRRMRPGQAPWQALIWRPNRLNGQRLGAAERLVCGGSLIAKGWILTAAHCLKDEGNDIGTAGHTVRLGVYNPQNAEGVTYPILKTIKHPKYNSRTSHVLDIALVQYDYRSGVKAGPVNAIAAISLDPLDVGTRTIAAGMPVYSYGWGWTAASGSSSTDYLQGVKMQLLTEPACTQVTKFRGSLLNAALCAGGPDGEQTCYGDSGGPLVYYGDRSRKPTLIGVVSAGKKCGTTGKPSRYTRVAKVSDWIASYVDP